MNVSAADISEGLKNLPSDAPVGHGYAQAMAGWNDSAIYGRLEAGYRPTANLSLFGFAQADYTKGVASTTGGVGAKFTF